MMTMRMITFVIMIPMMMMMTMIAFIVMIPMMTMTMSDCMSSFFSPAFDDTKCYDDDDKYDDNSYKQLHTIHRHLQ